jgi:hypothetical protein
MEPPSAQGWPLLGWLLLAVGFGIATRRRVGNLSVIGWGFVLVVAWLIPQMLVAGSYIAHDWRRGNSTALRDRVLRVTPIGSTMDQVRSAIQQEGWRLDSVDDANGFLNQDDANRPVVGVKHIQANAGDYQGLPFQANVSVFWGFDAAGTLVDIWVWRTVNGL